jgi:ADP-heptose:LPS heptosyltransferase
MLTAAVRDLHLNYPGGFITDVRTPFPELWENNPYITRLNEQDRLVKKIECHYPLINKSNETPHHLIHGFIHFLNDRLSLNIKISAFKGDVHLSREEKEWTSQVGEIAGQEIPFWIVVAGGKHDVTIKWWDSKRYQRITDYFEGKIQFVQVGAAGHYHPKLNGVIDLREKTNLRQLVRLMYHAQGVVCPVTSAMHLAAAVEAKPRMLKNRPCVVIAGGREPSQWEAYPHHQFIHTNGALLCCDNGGCWKSRTLPIGDGDERDQPGHLCVDVVKKLPRCMDMISAREVTRRIETYFQGGAVNYLSSKETVIAKRAVQKGKVCKWQKSALEELTFRRVSEEFIRQIPEYSDCFTGTGIVICAGGIKYLTCAWVCVRMLRKLGCHLPIEIWHLGKKEVNNKISRLLEKRGVKFVDALQLQKTRPARVLDGWPLKAYAILNCHFKNVLLLDADNVPVRNPTYLFNCPEFKKTGAVFWPDYGRLDSTYSIWKTCGIRYQDEPAFESGQILVDKAKCWKALSLTLWYNEHADFYYQHILGDKDTFHMAFRKLDQPYSMPTTPIKSLPGVMCQHDFNGRRVFQHRNLRKWSLKGNNPNTSGFLFEKECLQFLCYLQKVINKR